MAKLVDATVSRAVARKGVEVRLLLGVFYGADGHFG